MEYKRLGKSGLKVSSLSLGSWLTFGNQISDDIAKELMYTAYDKGVNFFDNAEVYAKGKSEIVMGKILAESGWSRDSYIVSSKVFWGGDKPTQNGLNRKHIFESCHAALKRLQVEYLDLFFCHRPDAETPVEETVFAMNDLIRQGKIFYWGTSEWDAQRITEAHAVAKANNLIGPTMEQPQYNMFKRDRVELEYRHLYTNFGMGTTIWSPLAGGILTGKYNNGMPDSVRADLPEMQNWKAKFETEEGKSMIEKAKAIGDLAKELGISSAVLAIAWCAKNPNISSVILGASKNYQLQETLTAIDALPLLTQDVLDKIESILQNKPQTPVFG